MLASHDYSTHYECDLSISDAFVVRHEAAAAPAGSSPSRGTSRLRGTFRTAPDLLYGVSALGTDVTHWNLPRHARAKPLPATDTSNRHVRTAFCTLPAEPPADPRMTPHSGHLLATPGMASGGEEPHPHKRRKVAESCKVCRTKKTRCDGQRPSCSPCVSKGIACEYSDATVPVSTSILSDIEARLRKLERQATATPAQSPAPNLVSNALSMYAVPLRRPKEF